MKAQRSLMTLAAFSLIAVLSFGSACTKPNPWKIATPKNLEAPSDSPRITRVHDIGGVTVLQGRPITPRPSDNVAVVGEAVVIRGTNLGRQPTVMIGQKPVSVLARLEDGGILVRVPPGLEPGSLPVTVSHRRGAGRSTITVRRYALAASPWTDAVSILEVGAKKARLTKRTIAAPNVEAMASHRFGAAAYLISGDGKGSATLHVVDLAAKTGPATTMTRKSGTGKIVGLAAASHADTAVSVVGGSLHIWDLESPLAPSAWDPVEIPSKLAAQSMTDIALSPDGKTAVFLLSKSNAFVLADIGDPARVRWSEPIVVNGGENTPVLVRALAFLREDVSARGSVQALWILSGDNSESLQVGRHPVEAKRYEVTSATTGEVMPEAKRAGGFKLDPAPPVISWAHTFNPQQVQSGTSLRRDPARMVFFVTASDPELYFLPSPLDTPSGRQRAVDLLQKDLDLGKVLQVDPKGRLHAFPSLPDDTLVSSPAVTTDGAVLLMTACKAQPKPQAEESAVAISCGIATVDVKAKKVEMLELAKPSLSAITPPLDFGQILIQP